MSLTEHLKGDLGAEISAVTDLRPIAADMAAEAGAASVVRPPQRRDLPHYAAVGGVVGQRLADVVQAAPPYAALLGAVRCGAMDLSAAGAAAVTWPTHHGLAPDLAVHTRPVPGGGSWQTVPAARHDPVPGDAPVAALFPAARAAMPAPGSLGTAAQEMRRLPLLQALTACETVHRAGVIPALLHELSATGQIPADHEVTRDAVAVLQAARGSVRDLARLSGAGTAAGIAAPVFVPQWADGDVLIGPHPADGSWTLLDIKTVTSADTVRITGWLRQVLAYAALDVADRWRIRRVGLWLPRHGLLLVRPLADLVGGLAAPARRRHILDVALAAARADGATTDTLTADLAHLR